MEHFQSDGRGQGGRMGDDGVLTFKSLRKACGAGVGRATLPPHYSAHSRQDHMRRKEVDKTQELQVGSTQPVRFLLQMIQRQELSGPGPPSQPSSWRP